MYAAEGHIPIGVVIEFLAPQMVPTGVFIGQGEDDDLLCPGSQFPPDVFLPDPGQMADGNENGTQQNYQGQSCGNPTPEDGFMPAFRQQTLLL